MPRFSLNKIALPAVGIILFVFPLLFAAIGQIRVLAGLIPALSTWATIPLALSFFAFLVYLASRVTTERARQIVEICLVAALAFSFRLALIALFSTRIESDFWDVHRFAADLATGQGIANIADYTYIPRVTYLNTTAGFLSIFYRIFGVDVRVGKLVMIGLSTLSTLALYLAAKRISGRHATALVAALLLALYPALAVYTGLTSPDHFAIFLICACFYFLAGIDRREPSWRWWLALGCIVGLVDWFRPVGIALTLAVLISEFVFLERSPGKTWILRRLGLAGIFILSFTFVSGMSVVLSRWAFQTPLPSNGQRLGHFLYIGFNVRTGGMYSDEDSQRINQIYAEHGVDFATANNRILAMALERISTDRAGLPGLFVRKFNKVWSNHDQLWEFSLNGSNDQEIAAYLTGLDQQVSLWITFMALISAAFSIVHRPSKPFFTIQLFVVGVSLLLLLTEVQTRYRLILIPALILFAADGTGLCAVYLSRLKPVIGSRQPSGGRG